MTVKKLLEKYQTIAKRYETVTVHEIINDLWQIKRQNDLRQFSKQERQKRQEKQRQ